MGFSERVSRAFAYAVRSWPFGGLFVAWTIIWWGGLGPRLGDPKPWLIWSVVTTFLTEVDLIVYGIYQRLQTIGDEQVQRNQLDTMRLLVSQAEAIWTVVGKLDAAVADLLKLAHSEAAIQEMLANQDKSIVQSLTTVRSLLEGHAQLAADLVEPINQILPREETPNEGSVGSDHAPPAPG